MDELVAILDASRERDDRERKFLAAMNGVDLTESEEESDIIDLKGSVAKSEGFGMGEGLSFMQLED
jgi:hypothetical protein